MNNILVPVDGSDYSGMAARWAVDVATRVGAKVTLLHIIQLESADMTGLSQMSREDIGQKFASQAAKRFEKAIAAMGEGAAFDTMTDYGSPAERIVKVANANKFDHIVMGSRGLTPMRELLLGSVSEIVLRRAPCPVTIVR